MPFLASLGIDHNTSSGVNFSANIVGAIHVCGLYRKNREKDRYPYHLSMLITEDKAVSMGRRWRAPQDKQFEEFHT